jgi:hypothetical protein
MNGRRKTEPPRQSEADAIQAAKTQLNGAPHLLWFLLFGPGATRTLRVPEKGGGLRQTE